jgi:stage V sporulation protein S
LSRLLKIPLINGSCKVLLIFVQSLCIQARKTHHHSIIKQCWISIEYFAGRHTMDIIKVKANSRTAAVAGAIAGVVREHKRADVQAIGAGAVNQAIKALVLATGYLAEDGINIVCVPEFVDVDIEGKVRTAIKLVVEPR